MTSPCYILPRLCERNSQLAICMIELSTDRYNVFVYNSLKVGAEMLFEIQKHRLTPRLFYFKHDFSTLVIILQQTRVDIVRRTCVRLLIAPCTHYNTNQTMPKMMLLTRMWYNTYTNINKWNVLYLFCVYFQQTMLFHWLNPWGFG